MSRRRAWRAMFRGIEMQHTPYQYCPHRSEDGDDKCGMICSPCAYCRRLRCVSCHAHYDTGDDDCRVGRRPSSPPPSSLTALFDPRPCPAGCGAQARPCSSCGLYDRCVQCGAHEKGGCPADRIRVERQREGGSSETPGNEPGAPSDVRGQWKLDTPPTRTKRAGKALIARGLPCLNTIKRPGTRVGIIAWNVNHWGGGPIDLLQHGLAVAKLVDQLQRAPFDRLEACFNVEALSRLRDEADELDEDGLSPAQAAARERILLADDAFLSKTLAQHRDALAAFSQRWKSVLGSYDEMAARSCVRQGRISMTIALRNLRLTARRLLIVELAAKKLGWKNVGAVNRLHGQRLLDAVVELDKALHKLLVVLHVVEGFLNNDWLDAWLLNEVNDVNAFAVALAEHCGQLPIAVGPGPLMISSGGRARHQEEFYPIVFRSDRIKVVGVRAINNVGEQARQPRTIFWDKRGTKYNDEFDTFRPIVLHQVVLLQCGDAEAWLGCLHTTPSGSEFNRPKIWRQLSKPLELLAAADRRPPIVIGGDYYLASEAVVDSRGEVLRKERKVFERLALFDKEWEKDDPDIESVMEEIHAEDPDYDLSRVEPEQTRWEAQQIKAAGELSKTDLNTVRNVKKVTAEAELGKAGWQLWQTLSGTNWKAKSVQTWLAAQIADYVIGTDDWKCAWTGLLRPTGNLTPLDVRDLAYSRYWRLASDHFPVGCCLSTIPDDPWIRVSRHGYGDEAVVATIERQLAEFREEQEVQQPGFYSSDSPDGPRLQLVFDAWDLDYPDDEAMALLPSLEGQLTRDAADAADSEDSEDSGSEEVEAP